MTPAPKRIEYLDCAKGLFILCITFLHFEDGVIPVWLNSWIGLFMITGFYFVSGWIFALKPQVDSPKTIWKKRLRQLGVPYLWFTCLILIFDVVWWLCGFMPIETIGRDLYKSVTLRGIGTLWFLPVLLFGEWLFCYVKASKKPWLSGSLLFVLTLLSAYAYYNVWMTHRDDSTLFKLLDSLVRPIVMSLGAWPIIAIGYLFAKRYQQHFNSHRNVIVTILSCAALVVSIWFVIAPPFEFFYLNSLISTLLPTIGFIGIFVTIGSTWVGDFFRYWGKNSLILMCTHFSITMEIILMFDSVVLHHDKFTGWITIIGFIAAVLITYPLVNLFNGPLSFMLGKSKQK